MISKVVTWGIGLFLLGFGGVSPRVSAQAIDRAGKAPDAPVYIDVRSVLSDEVKRNAGPNQVVNYGLKYEDFDRLMADVPTISMALPIREFGWPIRALDRSIDGRVVGTTHHYADFYGLNVDRGRFLAATDVVRYENYAVLGPEVARTLFPEQDPIGKAVKVGSDYYTVVGVLKERADLPGVGGESEAQSRNKSVYIPLSTCRLRFGERIVINRPPGAARAEETQLSRLILQLLDDAKVEETATLIRSRLKPSHPRGDVEVVIVRPDRKAK
jgi:putative ABC transport system permease protein